MNQISATIIADSKNTFGQRITTFKLIFPRIILSEFNTHRMLSKNSASSRAIPFKKMVKQVEENPFIPIKWMKEHKGMQGTEYFSVNEVESTLLHEKWYEARDYAVLQAKKLSHIGLTKQLCNRLLEPFLWHTVLVTATDFENFFALRAHPAAEIHIADLAEKMLVAYNESEPKQLNPGEWHIPFGDNFDEEKLHQLATTGLDESKHYLWRSIANKIKRKVATARCARLSYETLGDEPKIDYDADLRLHDQLLESGHFSPFEHVARAMSKEELSDNLDFGWSGNFHGFVQYRKMILNENKTDSRVKK